MDGKIQTSIWAGNIGIILPPFDSTHVGTKMSDAKTPAIDSSSRRGKARKYYVPDHPESELDSSDSSSSESDLSNDID